MNEEWVLLSAKDPERRYRVIAVVSDLFAQILGGGFRDVVPYEPVADLRIVGARVSSWRGVIELLVTSESFAPIPEELIASGVAWAPSFSFVARDDVAA